MKFLIDRKKIAVIHGEKQLSYKELIRNSLYFAEQLKLEEAEEKVLLFMENRPEMAYGVMSTWEKNGAIVTVDSSSSVKELIYFLNDSTPSYLFTSEKNYEVSKAAVELATCETKIINIDDVVIPEDFNPSKDYINSPEGDQTVLLLYTSGTTGAPKGVMLTMDNLLVNINNISQLDLYREDDRVLALLPLHHVLPLIGTLIAPLKIGSTSILIDELSSDVIRKALIEHKITLFIGVPRVWEIFHKGLMNKINSSLIARTLFKLVAATGSINLGRKVFKKVQEGFGGHIHIMVSGGAKIDPQIVKDFNTLGFNFLEGYGLTETSPILTFNRPGDIRPGSCGGPLPGIELCIADDGEVIAKGRNVMKGYYKKPEATAEVIDKDGWFHTGDIGEIRDGYLYLTGRKKEMIVLSNGKNINPEDIERKILKSTDLIKELAITEHKNHLVAIVFPDLGAMEAKGIKNIKETIKWDIIDSYNVGAPNYKKILDFKIVQEELPKTKLGKLRRFLLKDLLLDTKKTTTNIVEPTFQEYIILKEFITKLKGSTPGPKDHFELDLGMDSLDFVELLSFVGNKFNITLPNGDFTPFPTTEDLAAYLHKEGVEITEKETDWKTLLNTDLDIFIPRSSIALKIAKSFLRPFFRSRVKVIAHNTKKVTDKPTIFIGNHQSMLDGFIFNDSIKNKKLNDTYYLAVSKHFSGSFKRWIANHGNVILLDVENNLTETLQAAAMVLRKGKNLVIFPEGARSRDGKLAEFKKAFAILSKTMDVPVQPFVIDGAYKSMPIGSKLPQKTTVDITFLDPIDPKNLDINSIVKLSKKNISNVLKK